MLTTAAAAAPRARWDRRDRTVAHRAEHAQGLARRIRALEAEAARPRAGHPGRSSRPGAPTCSTLPGIGPIVAATVLTAPGRTPAAAATTPPSRCSPAPRRSPPPRARPCATGSTAAGDRQLNRALHVDRALPAALRPAHPRLRRTPPRRRQDRPRDPPLPQALHRPPALPTARNPPLTPLTNHRSVSPRDLKSEGAPRRPRGRPGCPSVPPGCAPHGR